MKRLLVIFCLLSLPLIVNAKTIYVPVEEDTTTILVVSDPHYGDEDVGILASNPDNSSGYYRLFSWADSANPKPTHVLMTGDITNLPTIDAADFVAWFDTIRCADCTLIPVVGNHDIATGSDAVNGYSRTRVDQSGRQQYPDIYSRIKNEYKPFYQERNYFYLDVGQVRIFSVPNIADTVNSSTSRYWDNCFPGINYSSVEECDNIDPENIKNPDSEMNKWIVSSLIDGKNKGINWNIIGTHRTWLAPSYASLRPCFDKYTRKNIVQDLYIENGANIFAQGDLHIGWLSKKLGSFSLTDSSGVVTTGTGAWFLNTRSHYVVRDTSLADPSPVKSNDLINWAIGNDVEEYTSNTYLYAMYLSFFRNVCTLKVIRAGKESGTETDLKATVVYSTVIIK